MVRKLALAVSIALGTISVPAHALGLGELDSTSALNQAFEGRIPLLSVRPDELDAIRIRLADAEAFDRAGIERPYFLTLFKFEPKTDASGKPVIAVTSGFPIREPFLNFLVEVNWPNGRLLREYAVLLDPPTMAAPAPVRVQPATRGAQDPRPATVARPAAQSPLPMTGDGYRVRANDTAWAIEQRIRPAGATMEQTMMALLETNPDAFINRNINLLKRGQILRLPSSDEILGLARQQARADFRDQQDAWLSQQDRQVAARADTGDGGGAAPGSPADDQLRIATVEPDSEVAPGPDTVPEAEEPAAPVAEELQQMLLAARENAESSRQEAEDLRVRMDDLQARLEDMKRLLSLKDDQLAQLQQQLSVPDATAPTTQPPVAEPPVEPAQPPVPVVDAVEPEPQVAADGASVPADSPAEPPVAPVDPVIAVPATPTQEPGETLATAPAVELPSISDFEMAPQVDADAVVREAIEGPAAAPVVDTAPAETVVVPTEPERPVAAVDSAVPAATAVLGGSDSSGPGADGPGQVSAGDGADAGVAQDAPAGGSPSLASLMATVEQYSVPLGIGAVLLMGLIGFAATRGRREADGAVGAPVLAGAGAGAGAVAAAEMDRGDVGRRGARDAREPTVDGDSTIPDELQAAIADLGDDSDVLDSPSQLDNLQDETGEVDPVSEADVYIAYGRYQQAKELLYQALAREPDRLALKHKLLEVHYATRDSKEFVSLAQQMSDSGQDTVDGASWARVVQMGHELDPRHPLFAVAGAAVAGGLMQASDEDSSTLLDPDSLSNRPDSVLAALEADQLEAPSEISIILDDPDMSESVTVDPGLPDSISIDELDSLEFEPPGSRKPAGSRSQDLSMDDDSLTDSLDLSAILDESVTTEPMADDTLDPVFTAEELQAQLDALSDLTGLDETLDETLDDSSRPLGRDHGGLGLVEEDVGRPPRGLDQPLDLSEAFDSQTLVGDDTLEFAVDAESVMTDDAVSTKLDLARAYVEMGDVDGARGILTEVVSEGDPAQQAEAQRLIDSLS